MPKVNTRSTPTQKKLGRRGSAVPVSDETTRQAYTDALRRICEVATDALNPRAEDDAARDALDALVPEFHSREELDAWWDSLPKVRAEVDPRLRERVKTSIRLSRKTIDGFDFLAKQKGIRSGQTLMKIVLESYLAKSLPPDF